MHLDKEQSNVVKHRNGHLLVLAGAGTGKTQCVTQRAKQRIESGIPGQRMLLLTFTNKAAKEMRQRIMSGLPDHAMPPTATTFHSFGFRFIRKNPEECNRLPNPSIMDDKDSTALMYNALKVALDDEKPEKQYLNAIDLIRSGGYEWDNHEDKAPIRAIMLSQGLNPKDAPYVQNAINLAAAERVKMNLLDFDDLIELPYRALRDNDLLRQKLKDYLLDITVDEAQDNNRAQYLLLEQLAGETVVMVGDDDQSIYRFRGAEPDNIWRFIDDFEPKQLRLERNYRSKPSIVDTATDVVRNNVKRLEKTPFAAADETETSGLDILQSNRGYEMVNQAADMIEEQILSGVKPSDIAVLYRIKALGQMIDKELFKRGIAMELRQGVSMHDKPEVKLLGSFIRLTVNQRDTLAFDKIAGLLPGVGKKLLTEVHSLSEDTGLPPLTAAIQLTESKKANEPLRQLEKALIDCLEIGPQSILDNIKASLPIDKFMFDLACSRKDIKKKDADEEINVKILNLEMESIAKTMVTVQETIDSRTNDEDEDEKWAAAMELIAEPPVDNDKHDLVIGSTIHGSKGLEWEKVHVLGMSDGIMPLRNMDGECENIEEERRLAYVAITRGADNVYIHSSKDIQLYGNVVQLGKSIFMSEIEASLHKQDESVSLRA
jgi:superfamily I DNA/RNA helicase